MHRYNKQFKKEVEEYHKSFNHQRKHIWMTIEIQIFYSTRSKNLNINLHFRFSKNNTIPSPKNANFL